MSQENVEIAKQVTDAINRRDWEAFYGLITADFEWHPAMPGTFAEVRYRGREEFEAYVLELEETWEYLRADMEEFRDLGDRVLLLGHMEGRGRASRAPVATQVAEIMDFEDGKLSRDRVFLDHDEAFRAAGLAE
jgi:ketosteroid isomerase-like protein